MQRRKAHLGSHGGSWPGPLKFAVLTFRQAFLATKDVPHTAKLSCCSHMRAGWGTRRGDLPELFRKLQPTPCQQLFWKVLSSWQKQLKAMRALQDEALFPKLLWEQKCTLTKESARETGTTKLTSSHHSLPLFWYGLLVMNEFLQSLLSNALTRKRAWRLLMEKSLSLLAL